MSRMTSQRGMEGGREGQDACCAVFASLSAGIHRITDTSMLMQFKTDALHSSKRPPPCSKTPKAPSHTEASARSLNKPPSQQPRSREAPHAKYSTLSPPLTNPGCTPAPRKTYRKNM